MIGTFIGAPSKPLYQDCDLLLVVHLREVSSILSSLSVADGKWPLKSAVLPKGHLLVHKACKQQGPTSEVVKTILIFGKACLETLLDQPLTLIYGLASRSDGKALHFLNLFLKLNQVKRQLQQQTSLTNKNFCYSLLSTFTKVRNHTQMRI